MTTTVSKILKTRDQNTKPAFQQQNPQTNIPSSEPKQQNPKPMNSSGEPLNLDGETHEPNSDWTHEHDSSGEGWFSSIFLFFVQTRNSSI